MGDKKNAAAVTLSPAALKVARARAKVRGIDVTEAVNRLVLYAFNRMEALRKNNEKKAKATKKKPAKKAVAKRKAPKKVTPVKRVAKKPAAKKKPVPAKVTPKRKREKKPKEERSEPTPAQAYADQANDDWGGDSDLTLDEEM